MNVVYPKNVPMMVLPGVLLLPNQLLPLHIFEDKYKMMIEDVIHGDRIFGICDESIYAPMQSNSIASVGLLHLCEKQEEGTSNLMLLGLQKVHMLHLNEDKPYPRVEIDPIEPPSLDKRQTDVIHEHIIEKIDPLLAEHPKANNVIKTMQQMQNLDLLIDYATQLIQTHPDRQKKIFQTVEIKEKMALFDKLFSE